MKTMKRSVLTVTLISMLAIPTICRAQNPLEEMALTLLSDKFGIDPEQARGFLGRSNMSPFDAAPVYATSHYTHHPVDEVSELREQGLGWGQIAQRLGMHPGTFNKLRKSGAFDRDAIWGSICKERYGVRDSDLAAIRKRGGSMRDALPACIIAKASKRSPVTVYRRFETDRNWERTAGAYKVDLRNYRKYAGHAVKAKRITPISVGAAKAHAKVQGRAHREDKSKHSPQAKGHSTSHGKKTGVVAHKASGSTKTHVKSVGKGQGKSGAKAHGKGSH